MTPLEQKYASVIAAVIKRERKKRKFTQLQIAQALSVSQSAVSKLEAGVLVPSAVLWFDLCRFIGIGPSCIADPFVTQE